jgi:hypothetical protein
MHDCRAKKVSQTLSGGSIHCLVELDIVRLGISGISKLKVGPCPGHVRHCLVGPDIVW